MSERTSTTPDKAREFYNRQFEGEQYTPWYDASAHTCFAPLRKFVQDFDLAGKKVVEIGCGRGVFQDLVDDYTGVDYAASASTFLRKPFVEASATSLPFDDDTFDAAWSIWVIEHVPDPETAFEEMRRVLKPGGLLYLAPAWHCRSWAADGYPVRPYSDFGLRGKLVKASIPIRNSLIWRALFLLPARIRRAIKRLASSDPTQFRYRRLTGNFETFWMSDSDAINSMDSFEALHWFISRGDQCLNYRGWMSRFLMRGGPLIIRIKKPTRSSP